MGYLAKIFFWQVASLQQSPDFMEGLDGGI